MRLHVYLARCSLVPRLHFPPFLALSTQCEISCGEWSLGMRLHVYLARCSLVLRLHFPPFLALSTQCEISCGEWSLGMRLVRCTSNLIPYIKLNTDTGGA